MIGVRSASVMSVFPARAISWAEMWQSREKASRGEISRRSCRTQGFGLHVEDQPTRKPACRRTSWIFPVPAVIVSRIAAQFRLMSP